MANKIVATFDKDLKKIEFYEIVGNYKEYTLLRKQGTSLFYIYNNEFALLSKDFRLEVIPSKRKEFINIIENRKDWHFGRVFFWADSKFVTEFGFDYYDQLMDIYKQLIKIRQTEHAINQTLYRLGAEEGIFTFLKYKYTFGRFIKTQRKSIKKLIKEFKVIW